MPIGGDDISNDVTTLVFQCLFTFALLPLRAAQHSRRGEGKSEVELKFQGLSCKLSFVFLPAARAPRRACLQANKRILIVFSIFIKR